MISRTALKALDIGLAQFPAVALLGPRQSGKTTLARDIASQRPAIYLDLERDEDLALLTDARLFLRAQRGKLVVIDEVQRSPDLFRSLRVEIDERRLLGEKSGHFLVLGSASRELLAQSSESLAGRIDYLELTPFHMGELTLLQFMSAWSRGGYPDSLLAFGEEQSYAWRRAYLSQVMERDIPFFSPRIPGATVRKLLAMVAAQQGGLLNSSRLAQNLGLSSQTVNRYLLLLTELFHLRSLSPWHNNATKRLTKSPKVYVRDSGVLHALLEIPSEDALLRHPIIGASFEGFVIEQVTSLLGPSWKYSFYRTQHGAEIDLICERGLDCLAIEIKRASRPVPSAGFYSGCEMIKATHQWVIHAGEHNVSLGDGVLAFPWTELVKKIQELDGR
jgi:uncharacterized protein